MTADEIRLLLETEYGLAPRVDGRGASGNRIAPDAQIGRNVSLGFNVTIHENVRLGDGVQVGDRVTLRNCDISAGVRIEDNCIVGYQTITGGFSHPFEEAKRVSPVRIGKETLIRCGSILYPSVAIGEHCWINHNVLLREHTSIGDYSCIGSMTDSEGYNSIGSHVLVHSQVHLCARLLIEDYVFVAPMAVFANGNPMNYAREAHSVERGATVRFGAQIAVNVVVLPGIEVGYESLVGPSTVLSRDVPDLAIMAGYPARQIGNVQPEMRMPLEVRRAYYSGGEEPPARDGTK
jgi:acetyltransferase-like isoleucine patch superfamily enzyme